MFSLALLPPCYPPALWQGGKKNLANNLANCQIMHKTHIGKISELAATHCWQNHFQGHDQGKGSWGAQVWSEIVCKVWVLVVTLIMMTIIKMIWRQWWRWDKCVNSGFTNTTASSFSQSQQLHWSASTSTTSDIISIIINHVSQQKHNPHHDILFFTIFKLDLTMVTIIHIPGGGLSASPILPRLPKFHLRKPPSPLLWLGVPA